MGKKIRSLLLSGSLLASTAMYAAPDTPETDKKEVKIENVQDVATQRAELEEKVKQAEDKLPNAFERGVGNVTSFLRTGAGYLADGISYPIRSAGKILGFGGEKLAQGVEGVGEFVGLPEAGKFAGSVVRAPTDLADTVLDATGKTVESVLNNTADVVMTGVDSAATLTRDPEEAGRTFLGNVVKNTAYGVGDIVENVGEVATLGSKELNTLPKFLGTAAHVGGDVAEIAIRDNIDYSNTPRYMDSSKNDPKANHLGQLLDGKTMEKVGARFDQFRYDMNKEIEGMMNSPQAKALSKASRAGDEVGAKKTMVDFMANSNTSDSASRIFGHINGALDDAKILSAEANAESKEIGLRERLKAAQQSKG